MIFLKMMAEQHHKKQMNESVYTQQILTESDPHNYDK